MGDISSRSRCLLCRMGTPMVDKNNMGTIRISSMPNKRTLAMEDTSRTRDTLSKASTALGTTRATRSLGNGSRMGTDSSRCGRRGSMTHRISRERMERGSRMVMSSRLLRSKSVSTIRDISSRGNQWNDSMLAMRSPSIPHDKNKEGK